MNFMYKLDDYETVAMLNKWFVENYPMGRTSIEITYHDVEKGYITCKAEVYRDVNDPFPATSNIAHGVRDQYIQNMRRFYAEDIASSALGRAITLLKGGQTATRDDMEKVGQVADKPTPKPFAEKLTERIIMPVEDDAWTVKAVQPAPSAAEAVALVQEVLGATKIDKDIPECKHGQRVWRTGNKNGKPWANMGCPLTPQRQETWADIDKCDPIWYVIDNNGAWKPQEARS
jgi:hypothetical protein